MEKEQRKILEQELLRAPHVQRDLPGNKMISKKELSEEKIKVLDQIGLIALDLDRTTLTKEGLTKGTKECLEEAIHRGIQVVIATGRPFVALPDEVKAINGLDYVIVSNGAHIVDLGSGEFIFSDYMASDASAWVRDYLYKAGFTIEIFTEGAAFIGQDKYDYYKSNFGVIDGAEYIVRTRKPVDDIWKFWDEHVDKIENINIHFTDQNDRARLRDELLANEDKGYTLTSSMSYNLEIGGANTSKANGLKEFSTISGIPLERTMCFGDSPNDKAMIAESGFGVAMGNAVQPLKDEADYITTGVREDGIYRACEHLGLF